MRISSWQFCSDTKSIVNLQLNKSVQAFCIHCTLSILSRKLRLCYTVTHKFVY